METKSLLYYYHRARLPVFVVLVDVTTGAAYWLFAQEYLRKKDDLSALKRQKNFTLYFNERDSLSDLKRFRDAFDSAERYMRDLYPGSPKAAIRARKEELQALDPNIDVDVWFDNGEKIQFIPKAPVELEFRGLTKNDLKSFQAMLDHGSDFVADVEIVPPKSPLLQELISSGKGKIQFTPGPPVEGQVQILCGSSLQTMVQVTGIWRGGAKSVQFNGNLENSPLSVEIRIEDFPSGEPKTHFGTPLNLTKWEGQQIFCLAWFDQIRDWITSLARGEEFKVNYFLRGTKAGSFTAVAETTKTIAGMLATLDWLNRAQFVAKQYNSQASLPLLAKIDAETESNVNELWALETANPVEWSMAGASFSIRGAPDMPVPNHYQTSLGATTGCMKLVGALPINFFGQVLEVPNVEQTFTNIELTDFRREASATSFTFKGQEGAALTRKKIG